MAALRDMPNILIDLENLLTWGRLWLSRTGSNDNTKEPCRFDKKQGMDFSKKVLDPSIAKAIATMLGEVPIVEPINNKSLLPPQPDCVEIGDTRVIGGIRPQNFDLAYRPDGLRIAYDSKTLNDTESVRKNWQNMINDLATEATTVHTRFPYALVAFLVAIPRPALDIAQELDIIRTLERLSGRRSVQNQNHLAEVISFIVWDPENGQIINDVPDQNSNLRIENFSKIINPIYLERYKGLPPHDKS